MNLYFLKNRGGLEKLEKLEKLENIEDHPWSEWSRGRGLSQSGLARSLKPFGIYSKTIRIGQEIRKGYEKKAFDDSFNRYLLPETPNQSVTMLKSSNDSTLDDFQSVTQTNDVTDEKQLKHLQTVGCNSVTDENGYLGENTYSDDDYEWMDLEEQEDRDGF